MKSEKDSRNSGLVARMTRSRSRTGRTKNANARLTAEELDSVIGAAKREGKAVGEWSREVLLAGARAEDTKAALFTELIALRLLMNAVLRSVVLGKPLTEAQYQNLLTEVRQTKHITARDVLSQYQRSMEGAQ